MKLLNFLLQVSLDVDSGQSYADLNILSENSRVDVYITIKSYFIKTGFD